jgi:hypothetical protein
VVIKVTSHVNGAFLGIIASLPIPSGFETFRIGSVQ